MGMRDYQSPSLSDWCFPPAFFSLRAVQAAAPGTTPVREAPPVLCLLSTDWSFQLALVAFQGHLLVPDREVIEKTFIFNAYIVSEGLTLSFQESFTPKLTRNSIASGMAYLGLWSPSWVHVKRKENQTISIFICFWDQFQLCHVLGQFYSIELIYVYGVCFNNFYPCVHYQKNLETTD